jgi:nitrite reductase/ring-hydroxylating ferredoxin subunit
MPDYVRVARRDEIPPQTARCVEAKGKRIALVNLGGEIFAVDDRCPHADASLGEGEVTGEEIICPLHFASFEVRTGACTGPPACEDLATFPVRVDGDDVLVDVG